MSSSFIETDAIKAAARGRELEILKAAGIEWKGGKGHIDCPYPDHGGTNDWRWDYKAAKARCTCIDGGDDIFTIIQKVRSCSFRDAKLFIAETIAPDLIRKRGDAKSGTAAKGSKVERALNPAAANRGDDLVRNYLGDRLGIDPDDIVPPSTQSAGHKQRACYVKSAGDRPAKLGDWPCAVFEAVAPDGRTGAFQIFLNRDDPQKKAVIADQDGEPVKSKRWLGKEREGDSLAGLAIWFGERAKASTVYVLEGIEDAAAVAVIHRDSLQIGTEAVAACIATAGVASFEPPSQVTDVIIVADRDERPNAKGIVSNAGQKAARRLALRLHERVRVRIALPGNPGEKCDVLDMVHNESWDATENRISEAVPFVPTADELAEVQKPVITVKAGNLATVVRQGAEALARSGEIYQRSGLLVRVLRTPEPMARDEGDGIERPRDSLVISAIRPEAVDLDLSKAADWRRQDSEGKVYSIDPPAKVGKIIAAADSEWNAAGIPRLIATTEVPLITQSSRIINKPGLDRESGILFEPGSTAFPAIPDKPTQKDAKAALAVLLDVIKGFPFVDEAARATFIAAVLTLVVRPFLRAAPIIVISAPKMASGKSLLAAIPGYIATGRSPAMMTAATSAENEAKRGLALLMQGAPVSVIDNITEPFSSDFMCTVATEPTYSDRVLGLSRVASVPTATVWILTGNNLEIVGDLTTRCVVCKIDPQVERPEERSFDVDLHKDVPARRGELIAAALTILKAYHVAGRPMDGALTTFGRFEGWSRMIREPLVWLGMPDPYGTKRHLEGQDPIREIIANVLEAWEEQFGSSAMTPGAVVQTAEENAKPAPRDSQGQDVDTTPDTTLLDALRDALPGRDMLTGRTLGYWLRKHENRVEGGRRFEQAGAYKKTTMWLVRNVSATSEHTSEGGGKGGNGGLFPTQHEKGLTGEGLFPDSAAEGADARNVRADPFNNQSENSHRYHRCHRPLKRGAI
ncbi:MAG: toprim domain-containing protein [Pseudomonadota bacterium]